MPPATRSPRRPDSGGGCCSAPHRETRVAQQRPAAAHAETAAAACQHAVSGSRLEQPDGSSDEEDGYHTAEETFSQHLLPLGAAAARTAAAAPASSALHADGVPFRQRRAYSWEGHWREDKELRDGMIESFEALGYPWWLMKVLRATPGHTWIISKTSDASVHKQSCLIPSRCLCFFPGPC